MALKKISINEHSLLLYKLSNLPYGDDKARQLEEAIRGNYQKYQELLLKLEQTISDYEATAAKIKACTSRRGIAIGSRLEPTEFID
ncbi:hypothetical protein [Mucilaginibacter paludis]|uniref:Uncharacterized protein n=1 Tax=Mucilaginibacter paludis DSM 18603 TaxID=714943 RepID=H1XZ33_9SPHI|nr:hypothetical protein [Mucilaginibacter paludis]EHQ24618.1 hypothetical protein Mucpa_0424 [Mucilaginibacter paludis DSM 18603]